MGFLKGTLTFSRYRTEDGGSKLTADFIDERLKKYAFRPGQLAAHEKVMGWTSLENVLDTSFAHAHYSLGGYLLFCLRIDRKLIPPTLLKVRLLEEQKAFLLEKGLKRLRRQQREAIGEAIRQELMENLPPVPSFFELCWSSTTGTVLFASLTEKVVEDFADFFRESFGLRLFPLCPADTPYLDADMRERLTAAERDEMAGGEAAVGREFLTWLWFKSEERNGAVMIPGTGDVEAMFVRRMVLAAGEGDYAESVVCQGLHTDLREGKEALRQGKRIREARLMLERDGAKWEFTFKADRFHFQSLKLPETEQQDEDRSGLLLERIYLVEQAIDTMDRLFALFLATRFSPAWEQELARMAKWCQS